MSDIAVCNIKRRLLAPFIWLGIINPSIWPIPDIFQINNDFASGRINHLRMPMYLTLIDYDPNGLIRFQGLSQEPHVYALISTPAFFISLYILPELKTRRKKYIPWVILISNIFTVSITYLIVIIILDKIIYQLLKKHI